MTDSARTVRLEAIDWLAFAPVLRIARAFRMALQPGKLVLALAAVLIIFGVGELMDLAWGDAVERHGVADQGVYEHTMERQSYGVAVRMHSARTLDRGLDQAPGVGDGRPTGVVGALRYMAVDTPRWLFTEHPWFAAVFGLIKLVVVGLFGGAICRMAATQACVGQPTSAAEALRYTAGRMMWFVLTPLMPCVLIGVLAGLLALAGLIFFNVPALDVVGSLLFGIFMLLGLVIALVGIGLALGLPLMYPCLAVEGTDGFDAVSRCYNYVFFRPWHYAFYAVAMVVFAAVCYLVVAAVASATINTTDYLVGAGSVSVMDDLPADPLTGEDPTRYDAAAAEAMHPLVPDGLTANELEGTLKPASWVMTQWVRFVWALVAAFMLSLYFCMQTWVYLLLRRAADATPLDDCDTGEGDVLWADTESAPREADA